MTTPPYVPPPMPIGTAAVSWIDTNNIAQLHVYSTDGNNITERYWAGSAWASTNFLAKGGQVSATCYVLNGQPYIRVYCNYEDVTTEWCSDAGSAWYTGSYTPA